MGRIQLAHKAKIDDGDAVVLQDKDVARVKVRVHESILENHLHEGAQPQPGDTLGIARPLGRVQNLDALDVGHTENAFRAELLENLREDHIGLVAKVFAKAAVVARFHAKIKLCIDGAAELVDGRLRRHRGKSGNLAQQLRHRAHHREIEGAYLQDIRPTDFDGNHAPVM